MQTKTHADRRNRINPQDKPVSEGRKAGKLTKQRSRRIMRKAKKLEGQKMKYGEIMRKKEKSGEFKGIGFESRYFLTYFDFDLF